jgi:hypothetical protein
MSVIPWRIPSGRLSVVMISPSIRKIILGIERGKIRSDFKRWDSNNPHIIIQRKVLSSVNQEEVCTSKNFHLRMEIGWQNRNKKEYRSQVKDLYSFGVVEKHIY